MKKTILFTGLILWLFLFSFVSEASNTTRNSRENTVNAFVLTPATRMVETKSSKDNKESKETKESAETFTTKELLTYLAQWEKLSKAEEQKSVDQIGSLSLTEGIGKRQIKLFAGSRKLLGKAEKEDEIIVAVFQVTEQKNGEKETLVSQEQSYTIGASRLWNAEISFDQIGVNYLLIQVKSPEGKIDYQIYKVIVEDTKTKDKLESMTLQFLR